MGSLHTVKNGTNPFPVREMYLLETVVDTFLPSSNGSICLGHQPKHATLFQHTPVVHIKAFLHYTLSVQETPTIRLLPTGGENAAIRQTYIVSYIPYQARTTYPSVPCCVMNSSVNFSFCTVMCKPGRDACTILLLLQGFDVRVVHRSARSG